MWIHKNMLHAFGHKLANPHVSTRKKQYAHSSCCYLLMQHVLLFRYYDHSVRVDNRYMK